MCPSYQQPSYFPLPSPRQYLANSGYFCYTSACIQKEYIEELWGVFFVWFLFFFCISGITLCIILHLFKRFPDLSSLYVFSGFEGIAFYLLIPCWQTFGLFGVLLLLKQTCCDHLCVFLLMQVWAVSPSSDPEM